MKRNVHVIPLVIGMLLLLSGCALLPSSRAKLSSKRTNAKYNVVFHGEESLNLSLAERNKEQNWLKQPPLLSSVWQVTEKDSLITPNLKRAEEKAVKTIQRYSVIEAGRELNEQVNKAYLLLGYSRYLSLRPFPALEAFRELRLKTDLPEFQAEALLGEAFVFYSLDNEQGFFQAMNAFESINRVETYTKALGTLLKGQWYLEHHHPEASIESAEKVLQMKTPDSLEIRTSLALAHMYLTLGQEEEAIPLWAKLAKIKSYDRAPYRILSRIELLKSQELTDSLYQESLDKLEKRWNNYQDRELIYRAKALGYLTQSRQAYSTIPVDSVRASMYLELSKKEFARSNQLGANTIKTANYDSLFSFQLERKNYPEALVYVDSLLQWPEGLEPLAKKKREGTKKKLESLITGLERIDQIDSLLSWTALTKESQVQRITEEVVQELDRKMKEDRARRLDSLVTNQAMSQGVEFAKNEFYFGNPEQIRIGQKAFEKDWGIRRAMDNWHINSPMPGIILEKVTNPNEQSAEPVETLVSGVEGDQIQDEAERIIQSRMDGLPSTEEEILRLLRERIELIFASSAIYRYELEDYENAVKQIVPLTLPENQPLIRANAYYTLYLFSLEQNEAQAEIYKNILLNEFSGSLFAMHLKALNALEPQVAKEIGGYFTLGRYGEVANAFEELRRNQTALSPALSLLYVKNQAKIAGEEAYKEALEQVRLLYPNSYASREAKTALDRIENPVKLDPSASERYSLIVDLGTANGPETITLFQKVEAVLDFENYLSVPSIDTFSPDRKLLVVHRFYRPDHIDELIKEHPEIIQSYSWYALKESDYIEAYRTKGWEQLVEKSQEIYVQ